MKPTPHLTTIEIASICISALTVLPALLVVITHLLVPITLETVYVGRLTVTAGLGAVAVGIFSLIQVILVLALVVKRRRHLQLVFGAIAASVSGCFACLLVIDYLTGVGLNQPGPAHVSLWAGVVLPLLAAFQLLRHHRQSASR